MRLRVPPRPLLLMLALVLASRAGAEVLELPTAALEAFEPAARDHLLVERGTLEALLESDTPPHQLAEAFGRLGKVYYGYELYDLAAIAWHNALELQAEDGRWLYLLGLLQRIEGEWEQAAQLLARAVAVDGGNLAARIHLGRLLIDRGDTSAAEQQFLAVREGDPSSAAAALGLARIALIEERYEQAMLWSRRVLALQPRADVAHHHLGLAYRALGDHQRALEHLALARHHEVVFADPLTDDLAEIVRGAAIQAKHGVEAMRAGRYQLAARHFERAVEIEGGGAHRYNLARSLSEGGRTELALAELRWLTAELPDHRDGQFNLASLLAQAGDAAGAERHFRRVVEIDPDDAEARIEWAAALSHLGRAGEAVQQLEALVADDPNDTAGRVALVTVLLEQGEQGAAVAAIETGLAGDVTDSEWATLERLLGEAALRGGDLAAAESAFRSALDRQPSAMAARFELGRLLARGGDYGPAAAEFRRLVEVEPAAVEYQISLGLALLLAGDDRATYQALQAASEALPRSVTLHHLLAQLIAGSTDATVRDGPRALLLARQVMAEEPTVDHAETVALAMAASGDFDGAVSWQRRVVAERQSLEPAVVARSRRRLESYQAGLLPPPPWSGAGR